MINKKTKYENMNYTDEEIKTIKQQARNEGRTDGIIMTWSMIIVSVIVLHILK